MTVSSLPDNYGGVDGQSCGVTTHGVRSERVGESVGADSNKLMCIVFLLFLHCPYGLQVDRRSP